MQTPDVIVRADQSVRRYPRKPWHGIIFDLAPPYESLLIILQRTENYDWIDLKQTYLYKTLTKNPLLKVET
jgi:hypothetical protein